MDGRFETSLGEAKISTGEDASLYSLIETGFRLSRAHEFELIADIALEACVRLTDSSLGIVLLRVTEEDGEVSSLRRTASIFNENFSTATVPGAGFSFSDIPDQLVRVDDAAAAIHRSFGGIPLEQLTLGSYMVIPVNGPAGEILASVLVGSEKPGAFMSRHEFALESLANQIGAALTNAQLALDLRRERQLNDAARRLQHETATRLEQVIDSTTPKHEAERKLAETARRLRQALDAGQLGTWSWDKDTDLLDLDERAGEILGADPHAPLTRSALRERIVVSDDLPLAPENLSELADSGKTYQTEYRIEVLGAKKWVSSRGLPTLSPEGGVVTGMTGTVQDITAQKTQEAVLRQTEKLAATGRMAATIAHEINNPLEAVTNLIYLSKTDPSISGEVQHLLELADTELARVSQIAQQTLGFYRDTSHPVDIDISGLLHGVADLFSRKLQSRNLRIDLDVLNDLHIFGLQGEVRQVFSNLIVNAIDASTTGTIRVRARPRSFLGLNGVAVMICDEGEGIPHEIRHKLFAPFFTTKESVGTGLGLWVTRGIVEKSGGKVGFRSRTDPPTGTVFRVFLPNADSAKEFARYPSATVLQ